MDESKRLDWPAAQPRTEADYPSIRCIYSQAVEGKASPGSLEGRKRSRGVGLYLGFLSLKPVVRRLVLSSRGTLPPFTMSALLPPPENSELPGPRKDLRKRRGADFSVLSGSFQQGPKTVRSSLRSALSRTFLGSLASNNTQSIPSVHRQLPINTCENPPG